MRQTLFHIPPEVFGIPTLGFGWVLILWCVVSIALARPIAKEHGWAHALIGMLPYLAIGSAIIIFVLPNIEEYRLDDPSINLGLPVRGYGVAMFFAVTTGVSITLRQATKVGIHADIVYSLAMWMFVLGFTGARLFYLIQYRDTLKSDTWLGFLGNAINITQGGLVVYGSLIGAMLAYTFFVVRHKLPALVVGDILAPAMLFGLAIGRFGCLLNGCCYGGPCDYPWAVRFPVNSPPFMDQMQAGWGQGFQLQADQEGNGRVKMLDPASPAARAGLKVGDVLRQLATDKMGLGPITQPTDGGELSTDTRIRLNASPNTKITATTVDGRQISWLSGLAPHRSLPIHPTQIYSALNAFFIGLVIIGLRPFQQRDGVLLATTLTIYPITRFLLEIIRTDEAAVNAAGFTISQTVSFLILAAAMGLWILILQRPRGRLRIA